MIRHQLITGPTGSGKTAALHKYVNDHTNDDGVAWLSTQRKDPSIRLSDVGADLIATTVHALTHTLIPQANHLHTYRTANPGSDRTPLMVAIDPLNMVLDKLEADPQDAYDADAYSGLRVLLTSGHTVGIHVYATADRAEQIPDDLRKLMTVTDATDLHVRS